MKKIIGLALAVIMLCGLCACGESADTTTAAAASTTAAATTAADGGFVFVYKGVTISLGQDMSEVLNAIGQPKGYFESESCAFKGLDKEYTYADFVIMTYPEDDKDYILEIDLTDDLVSTVEGISIGATREQVEAAYKGDTFNTIGSSGMQYTREDTKVLFVLDDASEKVQSVQYYLITDAK